MEGFNLLNKAFDSRVRLGLMSILSVNEWISYKEVKNLLDLTDGNLASHIQALEKINFLEIKKQFIGKKPLTTYRITEIGKNAFKDHVSGLEKLINN
ncbi:MAG: transcriptional regulator [Flavobacteriales bacterium]|jgi:predicted transcriptional regulator|nr:transcriptional regulator [Flavobacteriales bacterium]MDG1440650.1 transcriptional regulator [Flavobacteriales bacterium]MDG1798927.1 transcriptional regulator [Flavobacteriales bacterium]|tara:strand:- start:151 stop:441 length:291 start_codon:yes stop_codon:yes gene_type:complete